MNILEFVAAALLLGINFLVAVACYSLRDFSRSRLEEICQRRHREARFGAILKSYDAALLAAEMLQVVFVVALILAGAEVLGLAPAVEWTPGLIARLSLLLPLYFVVNVLLPWTTARVGGEWFLFHAWPVLTALRTALSPILWLCYRFDALVHRVAGVEQPEEGDAATLTEEIRTVVDEGQREGVLRSEARTMIHRVMELQEVDVADIMTPRTAMVCLESDQSLDDARKLLLEAGHSRVPVIGKTTDDIVGMLYAKDLLRFLEPRESEHTTLEQIVRQPFYVPETMGIDTLLKTFKKERVHLAIVLDEYGGVAGLVTMEDILEEIVGEIIDEYDPAFNDPIRPVAPGVNEVDARLHIDDVNEQLHLNLPSDGDFDTLGGFVFSLLGRIPAVGEEFRWEQLRFKVLEADNRRIVRLQIQIDESIPAASEE